MIWVALKFPWVIQLVLVPLVTSETAFYFIILCLCCIAVLGSGFKSCISHMLVFVFLNGFRYGCWVQMNGSDRKVLVYNNLVHEDLREEKEHGGLGWQVRNF
jgi:hypothetical protein